MSDHEIAKLPLWWPFIAHDEVWDKHPVCPLCYLKFGCRQTVHDNECTARRAGHTRKDHA